MEHTKGLDNMNKPQLEKMTNEIYKSNLDVTNNAQDALSITINTLSLQLDHKEITSGEYHVLLDYLWREYS